MNLREQRMTLNSPVTDPNWRDRLSIGAKRMVLTFKLFSSRTGPSRLKQIAISSKKIIALVSPSAKQGKAHNVKSIANSCTAGNTPILAEEKQNGRNKDSDLCVLGIEHATDEISHRICI